MASAMNGLAFSPPSFSLLFFMSFDLQTNHRTLSFTYNAVSVPRLYSGETDLHNSQTVPTFFGSYAETTSTCPKEALNSIQSWFNNPVGVVVHFPCFGEIPVGGLLAGGIRWVAEVGQNGLCLLRCSKNAVPQPYFVNNAHPVESDLPIDQATGRFIDVPGTPVGRVKFGFCITPEENSFSYQRSGSSVTFAPIPFLVVPERHIFLTDQPPQD